MRSAIGDSEIHWLLESMPRGTPSPRPMQYPLVPVGHLKMLQIAQPALVCRNETRTRRFSGIGVLGADAVLVGAPRGASQGDAAIPFRTEMSPQASLDGAVPGDDGLGLHDHERVAPA